MRRWQRRQSVETNLSVSQWHGSWACDKVDYNVIGLPKKKHRRKRTCKWPTSSTEESHCPKTTTSSSWEICIVSDLSLVLSFCLPAGEIHMWVQDTDHVNTV